MSTDRDIAPYVRSWLKSDADESAERVLDEVLARLDTTPQRRARAWTAPRFPSMNTTMRLTVAAVVLVTAAVLGYGAISNVGEAPDPSTGPSESESAFAPMPSLEEGFRIPDELRHVFIGAPRELPGLSENVREAQFSLSSQSFEFYSGGATPLMHSRADVSPDGDLRLVASGTAAACTRGDIGLYRFTFAAEGSLLELEPLDDECEARMSAVAGTWQRSACANPENWCLGDLGAGRYSSQYFEPLPEGPWQPRFGAFSYEVPDGWANSDDWSDMYVLVPQSEYVRYDEWCATPDACPDSISLYAGAEPAPLDCSEPDDSTGPVTASELRSWVENHPALDVASLPPNFEIDRAPATMYEVTVRDDWTGTCDVESPYIAAPFFFRPGGYHVALAGRDRFNVVIVDLAFSSRATPHAAPLVIIIDSRDPADLEAFTDEAFSVMRSFRFTEH